MTENLAKELLENKNAYLTAEGQRILESIVKK